MFKNKNITVLGAGISGVGVAEVLADVGACVTLYDAMERTIENEVKEKIVSAGGKIIMNKPVSQAIEHAEIVVLSPGISIYSSDVVKAQLAGKKVISEVEIAYLLNPGQLIAITGTNGKTTTTTLLGEMVARKPVLSAVGGNIGQALSKQCTSLNTFDSILVAEISSFQLEGIDTFKPHISAILNITPDHLDRHKTFEKYVEEKAKVLKNQTKTDYAILNIDDLNVKKLGLNTQAKVCYFSSCKELDEGVFVDINGIITLKYEGETIQFCSINEMLLFGKHNVENALVACACAYFAGVSKEDIIAVLTTFMGVEHRIEYVVEIDGVKYYNDSKATNPESTIKALEAFSVPLVFIAGGYDKHTDLSEMMGLVKNKVKHAIFIGNAKKRFMESALQHDVENASIVGSFLGAIELAYKIAEHGEVVLLSPACASFDMFKNYEERGKFFKKIVNDIAMKSGEHL